MNAKKEINDLMSEVLSKFHRNKLSPKLLEKTLTQIKNSVL